LGDRVRPYRRGRPPGRDLGQHRHQGGANTLKQASYAGDPMYRPPIRFAGSEIVRGSSSHVRSPRWARSPCTSAEPRLRADFMANVFMA
jgi:hypothetical protein